MVGLLLVLFELKNLCRAGEQQYRYRVADIIMIDTLSLSRGIEKSKRLSARCLRFKSCRESKFVNATTWLPFCRVSAQLRVHLRRRSLWYPNNGHGCKATVPILTSSTVLDRRRSHLEGTSHPPHPTPNLYPYRCRRRFAEETCHPIGEHTRVCKYSPSLLLQLVDVFYYNI